MLIFALKPNQLIVVVLIICSCFFVVPTPYFWLIIAICFIVSCTLMHRNLKSAAKPPEQSQIIKS